MYQVSDVIELWQVALTTPLHGANCSCCAVAPVKLQPQALEEDLLDYLISRYTQEETAGLEELLQARYTNRSGNFVDWLRTIPECGLSSALQMQLLKDILKVLKSISDSKHV